MKGPRLNRSFSLETADRISAGAGGYRTQWRVLGRLWGDVRAATLVTQTGQAGVLTQERREIIVRAAPVGDDARPMAGNRLVDATGVYDVIGVSEWDINARYLACRVSRQVAS